MNPDPTQNRRSGRGIGQAFVAMLVLLGILIGTAWASTTSLPFKLRAWNTSTIYWQVDDSGNMTDDTVGTHSGAHTHTGKQKWKVAGATAASITAADPLVPTAQVCLVSGNTSFTEITTGTFTSGDTLILVFSGTPTITKGKDIVTQFNSRVESANDVLTLVYTGTSFKETGHSTN